MVLTKLVRDDLELCNRLIVEHMDSPVSLIPQLAAHIVAAGGKRLRPLLTLAAARMCGYRGERHAALAACVEFLHTATLLHDDVVDESSLRRGQASANALFGNKPSVLVGDFLFARAFQLMVRDGSLRVLAILSQAAATISAKPAQWFHFSGCPRYQNENPANTSRVITSCMPFSCAALERLLPIRLAGIMNRYSKNAIPQLARITFGNATSLCLRCAYQAKVMKMLEHTSSSGGRKRS